VRGAEKEADTKTKSLVEVHGRGKQKFVSSAAMLFREKFTKQATTTVDQVKAMNFKSEKSFSGYYP